MVDITLPEPDLRFLRPERAVADPTAQSIEAAGNVILEANKLRKTNQIQQDMEELERGILDPQSQAEIDKFGNEMQRLTGLRNAGREAEFKVRAEARLKEHIASAPFLASELRERARRTLGFDPTGSAIQAKFDAIDQQEAAQAAALEEHKKWLTVQDANNISRGIYTNIKTRIDDTSQRLFGKNYENMTEAEWASIDANERQGFISVLQETKHDLPHVLRQQLPYNVSETKYNNMLAANVAQIDAVIAKLDPGEDAVRKENAFKVTMSQLRGDLMGTKEGLAAILWSQSTDLPLPAAKAAKAHKSFIEVAESWLLKDDSTATDLGMDEDMPAEEKSAQVKEITTGATQWMKGAEWEKMSDEQKQLAGTFFNNYTRSLTGTALKPNHKQRVLESLADLGVTNYVRGADTDSEAMFNVLNGARDYAVSSSAAASNEAAQALMTKVVVGRKDRKHTLAKDVIRGKLEGGLVRISTTKDLDTPLANKLQRNYGNRINTAIKAVANVYGMSYEEAAQTLFKFNPEAFSWIEGAVVEEIEGDAG